MNHCRPPARQVHTETGRFGGAIPGMVIRKTVKMVAVASPLGTQYSGLELGAHFASFGM